MNTHFTSKQNNSLKNIYLLSASIVILFAGVVAFSVSQDTTSKSLATSTISCSNAPVVSTLLSASVLNPNVSLYNSTPLQSDIQSYTVCKLDEQSNSIPAMIIGIVHFLNNAK